MINDTTLDAIEAAVESAGFTAQGIASVKQASPDAADVLPHR